MKSVATGLEKKQCKLCGSTKNLIYHHTSYEPETIIVICESCHKRKATHANLTRPIGFGTKIISQTETTGDNLLIGVTFPKEWIKQIDAAIKNDPMVNRQDFIRNAIKKELEVTL